MYVYREGGREGGDQGLHNTRLTVLWLAAESQGQVDIVR